MNHNRQMLLRLRRPGLLIGSTKSLDLYHHWLKLSVEHIFEWANHAHYPFKQEEGTTPIGFNKPQHSTYDTMVERTAR